MRKKFIKNQKYFLVVANRLPELYLKCVLQRKGKVVENEKYGRKTVTLN